MNEQAAITRKPDAMPADIAAKLREIGAQIAPEETAELYIPLHTTEPYFGVAVQRDLSYGPAERNILDVFTSPDPGSGKPVMVFVHGGGFIRGAKRLEGTPFYDNIALWAVGESMVGVTVNYRLAPDHQWPSGIEDMRAIVDWLKANIAKYGGDPEKIFLWGHSAGAAHVGDYLAAEVRQDRTPGIAGGILTSGFFELGNEVSVWSAYYGNDVSKYLDRSALPALAESPVPILANDAELDPEIFTDETRKLVDARKAAGTPVQYVHLSDHSHISETYAVGTDDHSLSDPIKDFVRAVTGAAQ